MKDENLKQFHSVLFFIMLSACLILCFILLFPFIHIIGWAIILTVIAQPLNKRISSHIKNPSIASLISCLIVVSIIVIPGIFLTVRVINEGIILIQSLQISISEDGTPFISFIYEWLEKYLNISRFQIESIILEKAEQIYSFLAKQSLAILKNLASGIFHLFIILITFFFLLRDFKQLISFVKAFIPLDEKLSNKLLDRAGNTIFTTVFVGVIVALTQGSLGGLAFWILGLPSPLLWGMVMVILCLIPFLGAPVVWLPAAIYLILNGIYWKAIILILWGMFVIGLVDNLIRSFIIGSQAKLHPLLVFFSVFGGVLFMGPLGLFMGPVILVITIFLADILKTKLAGNNG